MRETLFGIQPITSISFSNDEIIENIMLLNNIDRFDLDCTYSTGVFWEKLPIPRHKARLLLRNCVEPKVGLHIINSARGILDEESSKQLQLFNFT